MRFSFFEKKPERVIERKNDAEADKAIQEKLDLRTIKDKLKTEAFRDNETLVNAMARLVFELKDKLPNYDTIISDDASGRLPSLFFKKLIDRERAKAGKRPVNHFFIASGRHFSGTTPAVRKFLDEKKTGVGKALAVTEFIDSGGSITGLINALEYSGIDFDVAAVSTRKDPNNPGAFGRDIDKILKKYLYYGTVSGAGLAFYNMYYLSGVVKNKGTDLAHPIKFETKNKEKLQANMKTAREDMAMLAEELSKLLD